MNERNIASDGTNGPLDLEQEWKNKYGEPLQNALRWIARWRKEARDESPREITYQEFYFRAEGALRFDGHAYHMDAGVAEAIAEMGTPGLLRAATSTELDTDMGQVPRLDYELALHIAHTNTVAGIVLPSCLRAFASDTAKDLQRGRGRDFEELLLLRTLSWWGVDHAVRLGLGVDKTRERSANSRVNRSRPAAQLVADTFVGAGLGTLFTYNSVIAAWEGHRHEGADHRKLEVKSQRKAIQRRFLEIDKLMTALPAVPND